VAIQDGAARRIRTSRCVTTAAASQANRALVCSAGLLRDNSIECEASAWLTRRQLTQADVERLREHAALWRQQLERLRQRLASVTIEPPTRVQ
jgi:hypothetical protein